MGSGAQVAALHAVFAARIGRIHLVHKQAKLGPLCGSASSVRAGASVEAHGGNPAIAASVVGLLAAVAVLFRAANTNPKHQRSPTQGGKKFTFLPVCGKFSDHSLPTAARRGTGV